MVASPAGRSGSLWFGAFNNARASTAEKFRRRIHRQIEGFAGDRLFALFAAIFPARPAVLDFEMFFDRRFHVIIAVAFVFDRDTGSYRVSRSQ